MAPFALFAQINLQGSVTDNETRKPLIGATVSITGTYLSTKTNENGKFYFKGIKESSLTISITYVGYQPIQKLINTSENLDFSLKKSTLLAEEVIVSATRAGINAATTFKNISKEDLQKNNFGQDLPFLLNQTPSVVVTSDAGAGVGYTGIRIRGSDPTRVNVTINGIPLNDSESQGTFWVNMPDFVSSVENIQIQRGVGTSTNGAGAFGGSLNIQTDASADSAFAEVNNSGGSFGTIKNTLKVGSGLINGKWSFEGRLSRIKSDGFIDRAQSDLKSFFASGSYYGKNSLLKVNVFSGREKTFQAWNGIPEAKLRGDKAALTTHYNNNIGSAYFTPADSANLFNAGSRTFNQFLYDDQTDNYQQDHYQLLYSKSLSNKFSFNAALHYTYGRGYYEEFKNNQAFENYNLTPLIIGADTVSQTDLIRRRWLDNDFYGATYSLSYNPNKQLNFTLGGAYNEYQGNHFGEIQWARFSSNSNIRERYYDEDASKTDFNTYAKVSYQLNKISLFADLQYRRITYNFLGFDNNLKNITQSDKLNFFNPKLGATYKLSENNNVYASASVAQKEPNRNDYTQSTPSSRPKAEKLYNIEAGYRFANTTITGGINLYSMIYKDQLVLTGQINDVGSYVRSNVDLSYRNGIEFDGALKISSKLGLAATATISSNKIDEFNEFIDNYDTFIQTKNSFTNTDIAFSPDFISSATLNYLPFKQLEIALLSKYVGSQFLDNTSNNTKKLNSFFVNDVRFNYQINLKGIKNLGIGLLVNNILNEKYESNGYTFAYIAGGTQINENYYYPQAGTNFLLSLNAKF